MHGMGREGVAEATDQIRRAAGVRLFGTQGPLHHLDASVSCQDPSSCTT